MWWIDLFTDMNPTDFFNFSFLPKYGVYFLQALGYTPVEASRALAQVRGQSDSANELVRLALRGMAGL